MSKPEFITSDTHLGAVPADTERAFLQFLDHVGTRGSRLIIAGDLFDFWFEYGEIIHGRFFRVLSALADLVDAGVGVVLMGGNHDAWGGAFLREHVGVEFHADQLRTTLAGRPALLVHGDGVGRGDLRYRALKAMIRSRPIVAGFRAIHPELGLRIARQASSTEAKSLPSADPGSEGRAQFLEEWARGRLEAEPDLDWVVCGHAHKPALVEASPGRYYLNGGDWITHRSYLQVDATGLPSLHRWEG
jgi:UDP-2,3-diacylglucosamine hydrolase